MFAKLSKKWQKRRRSKTEDATKILDTIDEESSVQSGNTSPLKKTKLGSPPPPSPPPPPVDSEPAFIPQDLQEYTLGSQEAIYLHRMKQKGPLEDVVQKRPQYKEVIEYIQSLKESDQPNWYKTSVSAIVSNDHLNFPNPPVLTRSYISEFMRECTTSSPQEWERPCSRPDCISKRNGGFRCRELLMPADLGHIMSVPEAERKKHLPVLIGWCYLCHLEDVTDSYLKNLRKTDEMRREDGIRQIHLFVVQVNVPGEYKMEKTCLGDEKFCGIFGPVPLFSPTNYQVSKTSAGLRCWLESDKLVFQ